MQYRRTVEAKAAFEFAFKELGAGEGLANWARENPTPFYQLYAKMLPKPVEVSGPVGGALVVRWEK